MSSRDFMRALFASTALCCGLASPAFAQDGSAIAVRQSIDGNGVDLFLGTLNLDAPALTIGQGDAQGLSYYKLLRGDSGWRDNIVAALGKSGSVMTVSLGGVSDRFTISGSIYIATEGNGATLTFNSGTNIYTYTRADGTIVRFDKNRAAPAPSYADEGKAIDITRPSGVKLTFGYDNIYYCSRTKPGASGDICTAHSTSYRLASVRSSHGYKLFFNYAEYELLEPDVVPNLATWYEVLGVSLINLAAASGASTPTQTFTYSYAGGSNYFEVTDALNRTTKYRFGTGGVVGITRPGSTGEDVTIAYASGKVSGVTSAAGTTGYSWSDAGGVRTLTLTDPLSHATTYRFDIASQRMTSMTDALGQVTSWQYDTSGRMTRATRPGGDYTGITYDARGNVTERRMVAKPGSGVADMVTSAAYPSSCTVAVTCNQPTATTDARGNTTDYTYDPAHGGVLTATAPAPVGGSVRPQTRYSYSSLQAYYSNGTSIVASGEPVTRLTGTSTCRTLAEPACIGTADETVSGMSYGPQVAGTGNNLLPVSVSQGAGDGSLTAATTFGYDDIGNRVTVDGPLAGAADMAIYRYDAGRQMVGMVGPDPDGAGSRKRLAARLSYDPKGRAILSEQGNVNGTSDGDWASFAPAQAVATSYDGVDRKLTETLKTGAIVHALTQYSYDHHRLDCTAVRMNPAAWGSLPGDACAAGAAGANGPDRITRYGYDAIDRATRVSSAYGTPEQSDDVTTTYTDNSQVASATDANGNKTTYEYDGFDRLLKTRYPVTAAGSGTSSTSDYEQLGYDAGGNVTSRRLRDGQSIAYGYDALNRMTMKDLPGAEPDVSYSYDLLGQPIAVGSATQSLTFSYDALGRNLTQSGPVGTVASQYDLAGRRTRLT